MATGVAEIALPNPSADLCFLCAIICSQLHLSDTVVGCNGWQNDEGGDVAISLIHSDDRGDVGSIPTHSTFAPSNRHLNSSSRKVGQFFQSIPQCDIISVKGHRARHITIKLQLENPIAPGTAPASQILLRLEIDQRACVQLACPPQAQRWQVPCISGESDLGGGASLGADSGVRGHVYHNGRHLPKNISIPVNLVQCHQFCGQGGLVGIPWNRSCALRLKSNLKKS
mmetsp:Transcript_26334/g.34605  ORF Transcript_26334/g.34605 Transcript_26334/m.34605 type:complete len:227 (-) Transcript_26334:30-710(-)